jgi:hypothetical protein
VIRRLLRVLGRLKSHSSAALIGGGSFALPRFGGKAAIRLVAD